jgi:hypothetical protein
VPEVEDISSPRHGRRGEGLMAARGTVYSRLVGWLVEYATMVPTPEEVDTPLCTASSSSPP